MIHELKILPKYFMSVVSGNKTFEVRKNDREFRVGDYIGLNEWSAQSGYLGHCTIAKITYILNDPEYCKEGYVILGFKRVKL